MEHPVLAAVSGVTGCLGFRDSLELMPMTILGQCSATPHFITVTVTLSKPTMKASPRVCQLRFLLDDINITSSTTDETPETDSFMYNPSVASGEADV